MRTGSVLSVESCEKSTVKKEQASRKATLALIDDVWQLLGFMVLNLSHKRLLAGCHAALFFPSARAAIGHAQANWPQQVRPAAMVRLVRRALLVGGGTVPDHVTVRKPVRLLVRRATFPRTQPSLIS